MKTLKLVCRVDDDELIKFWESKEMDEGPIHHELLTDDLENGAFKGKISIVSAWVVDDEDYMDDLETMIHYS